MKKPKQAIFNEVNQIYFDSKLKIIIDENINEPKHTMRNILMYAWYLSRMLENINEPISPETIKTAPNILYAVESNP